ncbi:MAG: hypothetical protein PHC53_05370, partial [Patescibacteria group bacterium]|nr:hypothetical protein [Patescibacteria group bacterium]
MAIKFNSSKDSSISNIMKGWTDPLLGKTGSSPLVAAIKTPSVGASPGTSPRQVYGSPLAKAVAKTPAPTPAPQTNPPPTTTPAPTQYDFSQDAIKGGQGIGEGLTAAQMGEKAAALSRAVAASGSPAPVANPTEIATPPPVTNNDYMGGYTPERVAGYTDDAGIWHPSTVTSMNPLNQDDYKTPEEFAQAIALRNMAVNQNEDYQKKLMEAAGENEDKLYQDKVRSLGLSSDVDATESAQELRSAETQLINSLAAKGMTLDNDSQAKAKMEELTQKFKDIALARSAKYQADVLAAKDSKFASLAAEKDSVLKRAQDALTAWQTLQTKQAQTENTQSQIVARDKKSEIDKMYKEGLIDVKQKEALIKQADEESKADLRTSQAGLADANTDYVSGAKTADTSAAADLKKAQTNRITTLLPAELKKLEAETNKLLTKGGGKAAGGGTGSGSDMATAYD